MAPRKRPKFYHVPSTTADSSRLRHTSFTASNGKISVRNNFVEVFNPASSSAMPNNDDVSSSLDSGDLAAGVDGMLDLNTLEFSSTSRRHFIPVSKFASASFIRFD